MLGIELAPRMMATCVHPDEKGLTIMPCYISFRGINVSTSAQNAGVFVGDISIPGWDANLKINSAHSSIYGFSNLEARTVNVTVDSQELVDGLINDQDVKPVWGTNL